jgi:hypothetical protein
MEREDWINNIIETASKIEEVETSPFLYQKLVTRLNRTEKESTSGVKFNRGWAIAFIIIVILNISALTIYKVKADIQKESAALENLSGELIANTTYNY